MRRILILGLLALSSGIIWGQTTLLECGQNSGNNFNGWYISPYQIFDEVEFDANSTAFFSEAGGNYSVTVTRRIDEMQSYEVLNVLFNFECEHNCTLENVSYYTSTDGENWIPVQSSRNNVAVSIANDSLDITYVRAIANASFFDNGKLSLNYAKVEGENKTEPNLALIAVNDDLAEDSFFIFNHLHSLNIETALEKPYEVLITSMSGQIIYREVFAGSNRIELPGDLAGIFIVTIIQDNTFKATKKVLI